jgi:hypothetical protein
MCLAFNTDRLKLAQSWLDRADEADNIKPDRMNALSLEKHAATSPSSGSSMIH